MQQTTLLKPPHLLEQDEEICTFLKNEVKQVFGRSIVTSKDCIDLKTDIFCKTNFKVSRDTLRRFFNLVANQYSPGASTIEILCKYCGYSSPGEFMEAKQKHVDNKLAEQQYFLKYLLKIFLAMPDVKDSDTFLCIMKTTVAYLKTNPKLADLFQKAIVKTENGMHYYFEQFINIDKLALYYGNGLALYINEARTPDRKVFGYGLMCLRHWYKKNYIALGNTFALFENSPFSKKSPSVCGMYFTAAILNATVSGQNADDILQHAYSLHVYFKAVKTQVQNSFEFIYCRALLMAGYAEAALYYTDHLLNTYLLPGMPDSYELYHTLQLLKCAALNDMSKTTEANEVFALINPIGFNFLSEEADTELYASLHLQLIETPGQIAALLDIGSIE